MKALAADMWGLTMSQAPAPASGAQSQERPAVTTVPIRATPANGEGEVGGGRLMYTLGWAELGGVPAGAPSWALVRPTVTEGRT